jgi:hypothetical protein
VGYAKQHPRTSSLLDSTREETSQRGYLESYSCPLNVEHWRERNRRIFKDSEPNVLFLKSSFLRSIVLGS